MPSTPSPALGARKQPRQARSQVTVDAVFEATIQVLGAVGAHRLTTTRVAERAGVSVGTLYQYYPNKHALLFAVLERHLARVGDTIEEATRAARGLPVATMVERLVEAFVRAKTERIDESRSLYAVANELDAAEMVMRMSRRNRAAIAAMLASASDARFDDVAMTAFMVQYAIIGPTRAVLEGGATARRLRALRGQIESMCLGYLGREARPR